MVLTLVSTDKVSLSMFVDFYKTLYDSDARVIDLNNVISSEMLNSIVKNAIGINIQRATSKTSAVIIKLKTKKDMTLEELPPEIERNSTYIIRFGLFSTTPEVLKDRPGDFGPVLQRWDANIKKLDGIV
jgi:hypothetical protein